MTKSISISADDNYAIVVTKHVDDKHVVARVYDIYGDQVTLTMLPKSVDEMVNSRDYVLGYKWVKIISAKNPTYWYADSIGKIFLVEPAEDEKWRLSIGRGFIDREDAEIVVLNDYPEILFSRQE